MRVTICLGLLGGIAFSREAWFPVDRIFPRAPFVFTLPENFAAPCDRIFQFDSRRRARLDNFLAATEKVFGSRHLFTHSARVLRLSAASAVGVSVSADFNGFLYSRLGKRNGKFRQSNARTGADYDCGNLRLERNLQNEFHVFARNAARSARARAKSFSLDFPAVRLFRNRNSADRIADRRGIVFSPHEKRGGRRGDFDARVYFDIADRRKLQQHRLDLESDADFRRRFRLLEIECFARENAFRRKV